MDIFNLLSDWMYRTFGSYSREPRIAIHPGTMKDPNNGQFRRVSSRAFATYLGAKLGDHRVVLVDELNELQKKDEAFNILNTFVNLWPTTDKEMLIAMHEVVRELSL